jgi:integrase
MATKRQRPGGNYEYKFTRAGVLPRPIYLTFKTQTEGDAYARKLEALLDAGIVPPELLGHAPRKQWLREHVEKYTSAQHVSAADRANLAVVLSRLPPRFELAELSVPWATAWVTALKREANLSPQTIRHHAGALARCLDWLVAQGTIPLNPLRMLRRGFAIYTPEDQRAVRAAGGEPKADVERDRRLTEAEETALRAILAGDKPEGRQRALELREGDALRLLFDLAIESAMRLREMYTLDVAQVDLARRTVFLDKTKNGSKRQVPLSSVAVDRVRGYLRTHKPVGRLFPWWDGDEAELPRTTAMLSRQFQRIADAAGCPDVRFHDLRHEATSRLFERTNLSDLEIAKITGHKSPRMLMRYANLRASDLASRLW